MMKLKASALVLLAGLALGGVQAQAQGPGGGGGMGGGGGFGGGRMTPQQMQQMRDDMMKTQMTALAVPEAAQTTILAYAQARETAATPLREQARTLQQGLANNISAEVAMRQLTAMRAAVAAEKTRRAAAEKELDTAVSYTKNPQLEAYLTLAGLIGDEASFVAPPGGGGGRGGRGGGGGRGQGGPGGGGGMGGPGMGGPGMGGAPA